MEFKQILIVEDQNDLLVTLELSVERLGYEPISVTSGDDALGRLIRMQIDNAPIDLIIYDTQVLGIIGAHPPSMAGMHFIETMRQIKIPTPVLVLAGYGDGGVVDRLTQLGCKDFIEKPFTPDEVEQKVMRLLDETNPCEIPAQSLEFWTAISDRARQPS